MDGMKYWTYLEKVNTPNNEQSLNKNDKTWENKSFFWEIEKFE